MAKACRAVPAACLSPWALASNTDTALSSLEGLGFIGKRQFTQEFIQECGTDSRHAHAHDCGLLMVMTRGMIPVQASAQLGRTRATNVDKAQLSSSICAYNRMQSTPSEFESNVVPAISKD